MQKIHPARLDELEEQAQAAEKEGKPFTLPAAEFVSIALELRGNRSRIKRARVKMRKLRDHVTELLQELPWQLIQGQTDEGATHHTAPCGEAPGIQLQPAPFEDFNK